MTPLGQ